MTLLDILSISAAVFAILMAGTGHLRLNLLLYSFQTVCLGAATVAHVAALKEDVYVSAVALIAIKALIVPFFLMWVMKKIDAHADPGATMPIPISMHLAIAALAMSYFLAQTLPHLAGLPGRYGGVAAAISLLLTGIIFMLTRRVALSQIIGFLTMENGIYLFAITETRGMPMFVELGVLLDILVAVMIAGLIVFRIKKSFEHIDVTQLSALKEN